MVNVVRGSVRRSSSSNIPITITVIVQIRMMRIRTIDSASIRAIHGPKQRQGLQSMQCNNIIQYNTTVPRLANQPSLCLLVDTVCGCSCNGIVGGSVKDTNGDPPTERNVDFHRVDFQKIFSNTIDLLLFKSAKTKTSRVLLPWAKSTRYI